MVGSRYLVPALAVAGIAVAADSKRCGDVTIENQSDADGLTSCSKIKGDITIAEHYAGGLVLDGIESIAGSLICEGGENVTSIEAPKLEIIEDEFSLTGLVRMTDLRMDSLTEVGSINFVALPKLQALSFTKGVTKAGRVRIENTDLNSLDGIDLESTEGMQILNNPHLTTVNVNNIVNATGHVDFSANSEKLEIRFPNLENAQNMTFRNTSLVALPSLKKTAGLLGFYSNYFQDFSAPNLTSTGDLVFVDNAKLNNISLPLLKTVNGAVQIANNTRLDAIDGFDSLTTIKGALDFTGNFTSVNLPKLDEIQGEFNIQSSGELDCDEDGLNDLESNTRGSFYCEGQVEDPQTLDPTRTGSGASPTETDAAGRVANPPAIIAMLALLGGALQFVL
ncbi:hypothetical protein VTO42DRAFT_3349 [Malbranchea cinnamomea]